MSLTAEQAATFSTIMKNTKRLGVAHQFLRDAGLSHNDANSLMNAAVIKHDCLPAHGDRWGDWVLNLVPVDNPSLDYSGKYYRHSPYWIKLSELQTWSGLNHWMHHLYEKDWARESVGDFVRAVMSVVDLPFPG